MRWTAPRTSDSSDGFGAAAWKRPALTIKRMRLRNICLLFIGFFVRGRFAGFNFVAITFPAQLYPVTQEPRAGAQCSSNERCGQIVSPKKKSCHDNQESRGNGPDALSHHFTSTGIMALSLPGG